MVLIKYSGKYVKIYFNMKITFSRSKILVTHTHTHTDGNEFPSLFNARSLVS